MACAFWLWGLWPFLFDILSFWDLSKKFCFRISVILQLRSRMTLIRNCRFVKSLVMIFPGVWKRKGKDFS